VTRTKANNPLSNHDFKKEATRKQVRDLLDGYCEMKSLTEDQLDHLSRAYRVWETFKQSHIRYFDADVDSNGNIIPIPGGPTDSRFLEQLSDMKNEFYAIQDLHKDLKAVNENLSVAIQDVGLITCAFNVAYVVPLTSPQHAASIPFVNGKQQCDVLATQAGRACQAVDICHHCKQLERPLAYPYKLSIRGVTC
jgi:hypothetical protein